MTPNETLYQTVKSAVVLLPADRPEWVRQAAGDLVEYAASLMAQDMDPHTIADIRSYRGAFEDDARVLYYLYARLLENAGHIACHPELLHILNATSPEELLQLPAETPADLARLLQWRNAWPSPADTA